MLGRLPGTRSPFIPEALAIASVTAVLKDVLGNALVSAVETAGLGDVAITALPPDRIVTGSEERTQLNLFLYRIGPYASVVTNPTNAPGSDSTGSLSLELWYLLSAFGGEDLQAEVLLGCAMQLFQDLSVLSSDRIREALGPMPSRPKKTLSPIYAALTKSSLASQVKQLKVHPRFLDADEMSKLWSSFQARYRPSVVYQVSAVVLGRTRTKAEETLT
jgi:hypothetical protein